MKPSRVYKKEQRAFERVVPLDDVINGSLEDLVEAWANDRKGELYPILMKAHDYEEGEDVTFAGVPSEISYHGEREGDNYRIFASIKWRELTAQKGFDYLEIDDNWGHKTYTFKGAPLHAGRRATIVLPNGTTVDGIIQFYPEVNTVSDWGHTSEVTSMVPHLVVHFQGNEMKINIEDAQIKAESHVASQ